MKAHIWRMVAATSCLLIIGSFVLRSGLVEAAVMNDYCMVPPFVAQSIPPLVMLDVGRDHKLYYQAYSDAADLNGDGTLDIDYTHTIDYYGYFDSYKCYDYSSSQFVPAATSADKFCTSGKWSGNFLNWVTMSRMDVLRKVLYGGNRIVDTTAATVLQRVYTPQDAHSWGKEITGRLCKSGTTYTHTCSINSDCDSGQTCANLDSDGKYLTPFAAATAPTTCTSVALPAAQSGKILVARYRHSSGKNCGTGNTQGMINSYEPGRLFHPTAVPNLAGTSTLVDYVTGFDNSSLAPSNTYADDYNIIAVTGFTPDVSGAWQFAVDGDDDVEVQVGGTVVVQYLGCHGPDNNQTHNGTITLTAGTTYTLVARHFEKGGGEGVRVWFKRPGAADWKYVSSDSTVTNPYASLALSAPTIEAGNECAIGTVDFITTGTPTVGVTVVSGSTQYHLFCNTTLSVAGTPIMRVLENKLNRIWDWSAKERPVCDTSLGTPTDYTVSAKVCADVSPDNRPSDKKDLAASGRETNCRAYTSTTGTTTYKPTGLLQKYSQGDGAKVCSKNLTKTCTTATTDSSDCGAGEGLCIYRAPMYFGMISGSYMKNESGGVLRKNLGTMLDEINLADGTFMTGTQGIINTFENMRIVGFRYGGNYDYNDASGGTCGWITDRPLAEGECRMWGNPIGEMFYETLRYFAGKGAATTDFVGGITNGNDSGLNLPLPSWGYTKGGTAYQPYDMFPTCSKPFALILSDINPSYDSDQIPGSSFSKNDDGITFFSEDTSTLPVLGLGTVTGGFSLLNQLTDTIGSHEPSTTSPIDGNSWFVGQSSISPWNYDNLCTSKNISYLSKVRGLCPEEPTKRGSYYTAALAYFGKTMFKTKTGKPDLTTYAVAMSSPVADLKIKAGSNTVTMVPIGKSISGCLGVQGSCIDKCTTTTVDANGIHLSGCATDAFCPSNQIVNFFVDDIRYNSDKDVIYASFRINYEDVEQGADHDMDAIVKYEICTQAAKDAGLGSCVTDLGSNLEVKLSSDYAAGCIDQVLG
ncbi:MAG TPA: PA14 domain-containing protein, partial [Geobacteraceae bacterium]|nr:PA14 domain-containing protein [Geobacteraceae bacterium]